MTKLHWHTVTTYLKKTLQLLMQSDVFKNFRLVGGTAMSLQQAHRMSIDIDLFTDAEYDSINFSAIHDFLIKTFPYCQTGNLPIGMGTAYFIGEDKNNAVKLDLFYTDQFIHSPLQIEGIRLAHIEDIIAMKLDVIQRESRKKDFWDIHELIDQYSFKQMLSLHKKRYPFSHNPKLIRNNILHCAIAGNDFDPICFKNKNWDFIVLDLIDFVSNDKEKTKN